MLLGSREMPLTTMGGSRKVQLVLHFHQDPDPWAGLGQSDLESLVLSKARALEESHPHGFRYWAFLVPVGTEVRRWRRRRFGRRALPALGSVEGWHWWLDKWPRPSAHTLVPPQLFSADVQFRMST
jgi:hypothetical protein